jgi:pimeloyl-ACP methyl ester carboxylesterase
MTTFDAGLDGVTGEQLRRQWLALPAVESIAGRLHSRAALILTGRKDELFPPDHYTELKEAVHSIEWHEFPDGDHTLSLCRREAVRRTVDWLVNRLGS